MRSEEIDWMNATQSISSLLSPYSSFRPYGTTITLAAPLLPSEVAVIVTN